MPVRCRTPWTTASTRSVVCSGQITTSPSSRGPAGAPSSSTGKDSTSVGESLPRCSALSTVMRAASTNSTATWPSSIPPDAAASTQASVTTVAGSASPITSTSSNDLCGPATRLGGPQLRGGALGVLVVGGDDALDELVPHDVLAAEVHELEAVDAPEDVVDHDQARLLVAREIDLRDVAGHDHLGAEPEAGEEHLHLLGARVLRLVEDHERVVERA